MAETIKMMNEKRPSRLEMSGITKKFGATVALDTISFSVAPGTVHALVGENGAGKSTLMKILSGAYQPDAGSMLLDGKPYRPRNPFEGRQKGIGMIYQELSLAPHLSVAENIMLGMEPCKNGIINWSEMHDRAEKAIGLFGHEELNSHQKVRDLSIGAKQLVEIGRTLASGCKVLVFDEPTSSLSHKDIRKLFEIIQGLRDADISIIYISHFLEEVAEIADTVTVLRDGCTVGTKNAKKTKPNELVEMMVGRDVNELYPRSVRERGEPILILNNLSGSQKPEDASITLCRGEVLGICGLVGAGRTELLRIIQGLDPVKSGHIKMATYFGEATPRQRWEQGVGMLSEDRKLEGLALNLDIADNITLTGLGEFGPAFFIDPGKQHDAAQKWIEKLGIRCRNTRQSVSELSGGNQQKVAFARLLQHDVDVLLLDEPTRGIDVAAKAQLYHIIDKLATKTKNNPGPKAILMVSSYLPELLGVCDRISIMARGKLGPAQPVSAVDEHKLMLAATGHNDLNEAQN